MPLRCTDKESEYLAISFSCLQAVSRSAAQKEKASQLGWDALLSPSHINDTTNIRLFLGNTKRIWKTFEEKNAAQVGPGIGTNGKEISPLPGNAVLIQSLTRS